MAAFFLSIQFDRGVIFLYGFGMETSIFMHEYVKNLRNALVFEL